MPDRNYNFSQHRRRITEPSEVYSDFNIWTPHAVQQYALGTVMDFDDGRRFRYTKNGAAALTLARMNAQPANTTDWFETAQTGITAPAAGDKEVVVIISGTAPTKDQWAEGWLIVNKGTGLGQMYKIKSNTVSASGPTVVLAEPIKTAWAATSEVSILLNRHSGAIVAPTSVSGVPIGVNLVAVPVNEYFWAQTKDPAPIFVDDGETVIRGEPVGKPGTHADPGGCGVVANDGTDVVYGICMHVGAVDEPAVVNLTLE